jgi:hypothetical protein
MPDEHGKLTEEEAIAKVIQLQSELQQDDNSQMAWYAKRVGGAICVFGFALMLMLFAYTVLSKSGDRPIVGLLVTGIIMGGGAFLSYWGYTNTKPPRPSDF